jgi:hypothetical protein
MLVLLLVPGCLGLQVVVGEELEPLVLVHGGAGSVPPEMVEPKFIGMKAAVRAGYSALAGGVVDAVQAAFQAMEDAEAFNAGRGSKLTVFGHVEMDASIMEGAGMEAGAVAAVGGVRHPVALARGVMENTSHVLVGGEGAARLADKLGVERVPEEWLITDRARELLEQWLEEHNITHLEEEEVQYGETLIIAERCAGVGEPGGPLAAWGRHRGRRGQGQVATWPGGQGQLAMWSGGQGARDRWSGGQVVRDRWVGGQVARGPGTGG